MSALNDSALENIPSTSTQKRNFKSEMKTNMSNRNNDKRCKYKTETKTKLQNRCENKNKNVKQKPKHK